jgi:glucose-1-phosphate adenylyltransferase
VTRPLKTTQLTRSTVALVLAGGRGSRLRQLTDHRAKPAVFFGGKFRIVDFALSNCVNSGIRRIGVITQYKSHSLIRHLQRGWSFLRGELDETLELLPAQQRLADESWYRGTADAVYQNLDIIRSKRPKYVLVLAGDHIYKMDYALMLKDHVEGGLPCTVGCIEVLRQEASAFGVMAADEARRIVSFEEKPQDPPAMPGRPGHSLASMGIYVFNADYLYRLLREDADAEGSAHDFGRDVIPRVVAQGQARAHPFSMSCVTSNAQAVDYWRDVGTLDAYWAANLDLASITPQLDLYDSEWPIWTHQFQMPPAKFVPDHHGRDGTISNTMVSSGCIINGSHLSNSVLFSNVRVEAFCRIDQSVIMPGVVVGQGCRLSKVIIDCACRLPPGLVVGEDPQADRLRFERTDQGVVLINTAMLERLGHPQSDYS